MSWRRLKDVFGKRLEDVLARCLEDVLKTSWQDVLKTSWRRLENILKTSWRRLEEVWLLKIFDSGEYIRLDQNLLKTSWRRLLKTKTKDVLKTSSRCLHQGKCLVSVHIVNVGCCRTSFTSRFTSVTKVACRLFSSTFNCDKLLSKLSLNKLSQFSLDKLSEASLVFNKAVFVDSSESRDILFVFRLVSNWILFVNVELAS